MERTKLGLSKDKMYKALGDGERTSKKVASIRMSDGSTFKRKNANQYGVAEGGNDYTEKRSNRTDRFDLGGTADSSNTGANMGGTMGSSVMKKGGGVGANESMFNKGEVIFYFKGKKANDFYKGLSNLMPDHEITMVNDDKVQAFFGNYSDLEDAMQMAKTYGMTYQGKYKTGGNLIGKQKNLDLNKNGKLDSEDFKMIRGEMKHGGSVNGAYLNTISSDKKSKILNNIAKQYGISVKNAEEEVKDADAEMLYEYIANDQHLRMDIYNDFKKNKYNNGGGLSDLPENPNNDAISYKTGGAIPYALKKRVENVKKKFGIDITKEMALQAYHWNTKDGMGGSGVGWEIFGQKFSMREVSRFNKRDSQTVGDTAIVLGEYYSKYANGGGLAKTPESFPNNDAVSYKTGGEVGNKTIKKRLEQLRKELRAERISYGELAELQSLAKYIDKNDVELLEAAGVPEFDENDKHANGGSTKGFEYTIGGL